MPTFYDSTKDAAETSEALRGLAHASRVFGNLDDLYPVLGDLLAGMRSLRQVLDQVSNTYVTSQPNAFDDHGNPVNGAKDALAAGDELHQAATLIDAAHDRLDAAMSAAGRIAWQGPRAIRQWVSIVFLQGEEADQVLDLITRDGEAAGIEHLKQWDYGDETTQAALENGYVYDTPPVGDLDRTMTEGDYALTYNPFHGYVSLLRAHNQAVEPENTESAAITPAGIAGGPAGGSVGTAVSGRVGTAAAAMKKDWFAAPPRAVQHAGRGLGR